MSSYSLVVSLHVVVAIFGLGPLAALALLTRPSAAGEQRQASIPPTPALRAFLRLLRVAQFGLAALFVSGATAIALVHGAFGHQRWMVVSFVLFLFAGAGTAFAQVSFKRALSTGTVGYIQRAHRSLLLVCAFVAAIAVLMEAKPF